MSILFPESPMVLNVALANEIGLNESIVLQQLHYWITINKKANRNFRDGFYWSYNSYADWQEKEFTFMSVSTVKRTFQSLEKMGLLLSSQKYNSMKVDKTKWYTIDYEMVQNLGKEPSNPCGSTSDQIGPMGGSDWSDGQSNLVPSSGQNEPTIPESSSESSSKISSKIDDDDDYNMRARESDIFENLSENLRLSGLFMKSDFVFIRKQLRDEGFTYELQNADIIKSSLAAYAKAAADVVRNRAALFVTCLKNEIATRKARIAVNNSAVENNDPVPTVPFYNWLEN